MKYSISLLCEGHRYSKEIVKKEYDAIVKARFALFQVLHLEEKFDMLLENFSEYENELLSVATHYVIFDDFSYQKANDQRMGISRRIVNLLTASRLFIDQSVHHLSNIFGDGSKQVLNAKKSMSKEYDEHLSYRTLEALRNYVQHRGFPIHSLTYSSALLKAELGSDAYTIMVPYLSTPELAKDGGFKKPVLAELIVTGDLIDLRPYVREYIDSLGRIMKHIREGMDKKVSTWEAQIYNTARSPLDQPDELSSAWILTLVKTSKAGKESGVVRVFPDFIDRRKRLEKKNRLIKSLSTHFVSNQVIEPSA